MDSAITDLPGAKRALGTLLAFSLIDAACTAGQAFTLAYALTLLWNLSPLPNTLPYVVGFAAFYLSRQGLQWLRSRYICRFAAHTSRDLLQQLAAHAFDAGAGAAHAREIGSTSTLFIEGISQVENYLALLLPKMADLMMIPAALTVALFLCDPISGFIALAMLPCIVGYMRMLGANAREAAAKQHGRFQIMSNHFIDTLRGMSTLKLLGRSKGYEKQVFDVSEKFREATVDTLKTATLSSLVLDLFRTFALAAIAIMLGFRLMAGDIPLFNAMAVLIMVPEFFAVIRRYSTDFHASLEGKNQLTSVMEYLQEPVVEAPAVDAVQWEEGCSLQLRGIGFSYESGESGTNETAGKGERVGARKGEVGARKGKAIRKNEKIGAENDEAIGAGKGEAVGAGKGERVGRSDAENTRVANFATASASVLKGLDLEIPHGAKVGIVGASGSGKSTLAQLLAGFSSPTEGSFRIGNVNASSNVYPNHGSSQPNVPLNSQEPIAIEASAADVTAANNAPTTAAKTATDNVQSADNVPAADDVPTLAWAGWRSHVVYLPQSPHLFNGTLAENIAFYRPDASAQSIRDAALSVGLGELLDSLPDGLDTVIGQGGRQLSGGQAQRVALARAFLDSRDVLIFDEPTAHLDVETELALASDMLRLMEGRTVIMATHRIYWMRQMDWLVVLDGGRAAQQGTFQQLASEPGAFQSLIASLQGGDRA